MSRIGKNPVVVPAGVTVEVANGIITVKGKNGQLTQEYSDVTVTVEGDHVQVQII
jgi:large subunit ribosomal protein L6